MLDVSNAPPQKDRSGPIPKDSIVVVQIALDGGDYSDPALGASAREAKQNPKTGNVYAPFTVTVVAGDYKGRKIFDSFNLKMDQYPDMVTDTMSMIRGILESEAGAHGVQPNLSINTIGDLNGKMFLVKTGHRKKKEGGKVVEGVVYSTVASVVTPADEDWYPWMYNGQVVTKDMMTGAGAMPQTQYPGNQPQPTQQAPAQQPATQQVQQPVQQPVQQTVAQPQPAPAQQNFQAPAGVAQNPQPAQQPVQQTAVQQQAPVQQPQPQGGWMNQV